jgi:hypothetical protein
MLGPMSPPVNVDTRISVGACLLIIVPPWWMHELAKVNPLSA